MKTRKKENNFFKRIWLVMLLVSMALPDVFVMAQEAGPSESGLSGSRFSEGEPLESGVWETGLFQNGRLLEDGDLISEGSALVWKQKVFLLEGAQVELRLPKQLVFSEENKKNATLTDDKGRVLPLSVTEKDGVVTGAVTDSGLQENVTTVSGGTVGASFAVSLPCMINQEFVTGNTVQINGKTLRLLKRRALALPGLPELPAYSVQLHRAKADGTPEDQPIANGDSLGLNDSLYLVIYKENLTDIEADTDYGIPLPAAIEAPQSAGSVDIVAKLSEIPNITQKYATLSWKAGERSLTLRFVDFAPVTVGGQEVTLKKLIQCYMYFSCGLTDDSTQADEDGKIQITLPGGGSLTVTVNDWVPKAPEIQKTVGALQPDGTAEWKITYTHPMAAYKGEFPEKLTDQLPEGLIFDTAHTKIEKNAVEDTSKAGLSFGASDTTFTYDFTAAGVTFGDSLVITCKTKMTNREFNRLWGSSSTVTYPNTVKGINAGHGVDAPVCSSQKNLEVPNNWTGRTVLAKDARVIPGDPDDPDNPWKIEWKVKVTASGRSFKKLHVIDTMGKGLKLVQSPPDNVKVKKTEGGSETDVTAAMPVEVSSETDGRTKMTVKLIDSPPTGSEKAGDFYTITYTTKIDPAYFNQTGSSTALEEKDVTNSATLAYEWPIGDEPGGTPFLPPSIKKGPGSLNFDNDLIKKTNPRYNPGDHSLIWTITVNPNQVNLTEAKIVDDLSDPKWKHLFVLNGVKTQAEAEGEISAAINAALAGIAGSSPAPSLNSLDITDNKLTAVVKNIGKKSFSFAITTWASDPATWAGTSSFNYINTVVMDHAGTKVNGSPVMKDSSSTASVQPVINVLKKENTKYDASEKKISWKLTINENGVNLGDVDIGDSLPAGLSCDPADAQLDNGAFDSTDNTFSVNADAASGINTINIHLSNVTGKRVITFKTAVDVNTADFHTEKEILFSNTATIKSASNTAPVSSNRSDMVLDNTVLNKTATPPNLSAGKITAKYTIKLNPQRMNLTQGKQPGAKVKLMDTLSDGLYLDTETVKLYHATPVSRKSGNKWITDLTKGAEVAPQPAVTCDAGTNSFFLEVPDPEESYIAEYTVYAVRTNVPLTNQAMIEGSVVPGNAGQGSSEMSFTMNASGGASFALPADKFFSIQIKNVNESGNTVKGAAVFALYADKAGTQPLVTATCDSETGTCTLALPRSALGSMNRLYWRALTPPPGYALNNEWHGVEVGNPPTAPLPMVNVSGADQTAATITLCKTDGTNPLKGAKFELYEEKECLTKVKDETAVAADGSLTFSGLYPGRHYWLKETQAPNGYVLPTGPVEIKAERTPAVTDIVNEKCNVTLEVTNVDAQDASVKLRDTEYILYEDAACQRPFGTLQTTDANGVCSFRNLKPYGTYYLQEKTASPGYEKNEVIYTVTTGANNATVTLQPANHAIGWNARASVAVTKTDADDRGNNGNQRLKGARFQLYQQDQVTLLDEKETDASGRCTFSGLKEGTYYLKEVKAPDGYEIMNEWTRVNVRINTAESVTIANLPIGWNTKASLQIVKTDGSHGPDGALRLEGAVFRLYESDQITSVGEKTTDAGGSCVFTGLKEGIYYLKEITAPEGYRLKEDLIKVTVRRNTAETVTIENSKIPADPPAAGNGGSGEDTGEGSTSGSGKRPQSQETVTDENKDGIRTGAGTVGSDRIPKTGVKDFTFLWVMGMVLSLLAAGGVFASWMLQKREIRKSGKARMRGSRKKRGSQGIRGDFGS